MQNKVSPVFSLADPVTITVKAVNEFDCLGEAFDGYHVAVFFRQLVNSVVSIDHKHPVALNRYCTMYNFINNRGTLYGHLFVVDKSKLDIKENRMIVRCNVREKSDFELQTFSSEKTKLLFFKSSSGTLIAIIAGAEQSECVVQGT